LQAEYEAQKCRELTEALWSLGIAYGEPPRLWRVSPRWFYLWGEQWQKIQDFGKLLPGLRWAVDKSQAPTYLRADFTFSRRAKPVLVELNGTPVWDYGTQAVRDLYTRIVGLPQATFDPFSGAALALSRLLNREFAGRRIVVLLSPDRVKYRAEYTKLAEFFKGRGLLSLVLDDADKLKNGDVVKVNYENIHGVNEARSIVVQRKK